MEPLIIRTRIHGLLLFLAISSTFQLAPTHPSSNLLTGGLTLEQTTLSSDPTVQSICELTSNPSTCQAIANTNPEAIFDSFDVNDPDNLKKLHQLVNPALRKICDRADDPDVCVFAYYLSGGTNDDGVESLHVVLDRLIQSTKLVCMRDQKEAVQFTDKLRRDNAPENARLTAYTACGEQFVKAAAEMVLAAQALQKGEIERVMHNVNRTMTYNDHCDEILHEATMTQTIPINDAGLVELVSSTEALHLFASNCMSLLEMMKH